MKTHKRAAGSAKQPFKGRTILFDISDKRAHQKLKKELEQLGATVSDVIEEASANYVCLVTDKKTLRPLLKLIRLNDQKTSAARSNKDANNGTLFSDRHTTGADSGLGLSDTVPEKRALRHQNAKKTAIKDQPLDLRIKNELQRFPMVYRIAYQRSIRICTLDEFTERLQKTKNDKWQIPQKKEKDRIDIRRAPSKPTTQRERPLPTEKKLVPPYVKTQDVLMRYRPSYVQLRQQQLKNWLVVHLGPGTAHNASIFHATTATQSRELEKLHNGSTEPMRLDARPAQPATAAAAAAAPNTAHCSRSTRRSPRFACTDRPYSPDPDRKGYCEICRREVDSMAKHAQGSTHIKRINAAGFWDVVDAECVSYHPLVKSKKMDIMTTASQRLVTELLRRPGRRGLDVMDAPAAAVAAQALNTSAVLPTDYGMSTAYDTNM